MPLYEQLVRGLPDWKLAVNFGLNHRYTRTSLREEDRDPVHIEEGFFQKRRQRSSLMLGDTIYSIP